MSVEKRTSVAASNRINQLGSGIQIGKVVSVLDPTFMGRLKITLLKGSGNRVGTEDKTYVVNYAPPFFGQTPFEGQGYNNYDFNDTQKSYGMWFVPPDIGVTVLCAFVDGDPGSGYWFGCVPPSFANHMVPAIAGSQNVDFGEDVQGSKSAERKKKYDSKIGLPVGEINKRHNANVGETDAEKIKKPIHPIADRFLEQGTLEDDIRGTTTTTARRQTPNSSFGIVSPGPLDYAEGAKRLQVGVLEHQSPTSVPISRLGGTQFVMDDGDDRYRRTSHASKGPYEYVDIQNGIIAGTGEKTNTKGEVGIPYNEYTRLRTRTGHQILMHNSEDLIYIANSRGTAWIELSSNGKIDVFSSDSVSIHTKNDFNLKADRDVNIEAGRNINMKATAEYISPTQSHRRNEDEDYAPLKEIQDEAGKEAGRIQIESAFNFNLLIGANGKIETRTYTNAEGVLVPGDLDINVISNTRIQQAINLDVKTGSRTCLTAGTNTEINSGSQHIETAPDAIHMNGPEARTADNALVITDLIIHDNILTDQNLNWSSTRYQSGKIKSIMRRIPMHEPWAQHENLSPSLQSQINTDREES